ncbi:MAG: chorismate synthase [Dehalococcoidales bacterium]
MSDSIGKVFTVSVFGESHGRLIGALINGCPAGLKIDEGFIQKELDRRKPAHSVSSTPRSEDDKAEILSGVFNGFTTGAPICLVINNKDTRSADYDNIKDVFRPGHADYTARIKYGGFNDYRGGGRFSGRITAGFVAAGAVSRMLLDIIGVDIFAHTVEIGGISAKSQDMGTIKQNINNPLSCADSAACELMLTAVKEARIEDDSLGGIIEGIATGLPVGLGEPVFDNLDGDLAKALFAVPSVKGVEFGMGFNAARLKGSQNNDPFEIIDGKIVTKTNNAGGILGGISNGMPLVVRVAVKPTPSISQKQLTVNLKEFSASELEIQGRHDACIVPRAIPVVEAMMAVTLCDFALRAGIIPRVIK